MDRLVGKSMRKSIMAKNAGIMFGMRLPTTRQPVRLRIPELRSATQVAIKQNR
jgi:hypothetical protein